MDGGLDAAGCRYVDMVNNGGPYKINYIRISCGANNSGYPDYAGHSPFPYVDVGGGVKKAQLANRVELPNTVQFDPVFWNGLRDVC